VRRKPFLRRHDVAIAELAAQLREVHEPVIARLVREHRPRGQRDLGRHADDLERVAHDARDRLDALAQRERALVAAVVGLARRRVGSIHREQDRVREVLDVARGRQRESRHRASTIARRPSSTRRTMHHSSGSGWRGP
jgi:hypothetical protein